MRKIGLILRTGGDIFFTVQVSKAALMLLLKRLATSFVLFIILFVCLFIGGLFVGGAIVGARAQAANSGAKDFRSGYEAGHKVGYEFGKRYGAIIFLGALGTSGVVSLAISFSGVLPWCRRDPQPPAIPRG